jgi:preprotein translocase subunit SecE
MQDSAIIQYFRETYFEVKKVSWPTRREAVNLTVIVILVTTFLSIVLGIIDWIYSMIFGLFL